MTINGGRPHEVGYRDQDYKITVHDADQGKRITVGWTQVRSTEQSLRALETRPGWSNAKCEVVEDHKTGV